MQLRQRRLIFPKRWLPSHRQREPTQRWRTNFNQSHAVHHQMPTSYRDCHEQHGNWSTNSEVWRSSTTFYVESSSTTVANNARKEPTHPRLIDMLWSNGPPSYPFHNIGIDLMGPLLLSNGNQHILLIGDHFPKWYEAIPLPDQTASTTATVLLENCICRFGCPHSIHSDQGQNFESKLFKSLNQALQIDKTRTTAFRPQSNAVVERINHTLQSMLAKCINDEQSNWSQHLRYVMMAYRTSVHESTGYSPHFLVYGQEVCLPIDFMYPNPSDQPPADIHEFVSAQQVRFQKAYDSARTALNFNQRRRNAIYNWKVHGPTYQVNQNVLVHNPVAPVGKSPNFFNPWKGPYVILQCLNDVTYRIQELATQKELVVHYDRLKLFHEPPPTSNVPTRDKKNRKTYLNQKFSSKNHQFPSRTTSNAPGIIRTIPSLQQPLVLAAFLAQPRLLGLHQQLHQLVPLKLYYRLPPLPILELQHPIAMALPAHRRQPLPSL